MLPAVQYGMYRILVTNGARVKHPRRDGRDAEGGRTPPAGGERLDFGEKSIQFSGMKLACYDVSWKTVVK